MKTQEQAVLKGSNVLLVPFEESHRAELCRVLDNPEIWKYTWRNIASRDQLERDFDQALEQQSRGTQIPFVIFDNKTGAVIGTTSIGDIDKFNRNVEIGWTSLSPEYWRTGVNTECKYMLLQYCFEQLSVIRVQFSVSSLNLRSQKAVERIGAVKEGVFRKHRVEPGGPVHDNIFYSILDTEWPSVKDHLVGLMEKQYV